MKWYSTFWSVVAIFGLASLMGCSIKPQEINYGADGCHFCRMTIVDAQHAAQLVTDKGKVYKFDAIECMVNYQRELDSNTIALSLCNHYTEPKELINVSEATFLISEGIPSPMGAYLTAFSSKGLAEAEKSRFGGSVYTWNELLKELNP